MRALLVPVVVCLGLAVATRAGAAQNAPPPAETAKLVEQARAHFDAGNAHYAAGRYTEALREFQAGYALVPRPNFLVNLGQAYRKLGNLDRAKEAYLAYVRALPQNSALRDQALQVLAEIEVQLQEQRGNRPAQPEPAPVASAPAPAPPPMPAPAPASSGSAANIVAMSIAGAGVALAGTALVFQLRAKNASDKLTALDRRMEPFDPELERRGRRDQRIGIALLGTGGATLAAAITIYLLMAPEPGSVEYAHTGRPRLRPRLGPGELGLSLSF